MSSQLASMNAWVDSVAQLSACDRVHWCDGSDAEYAALTRMMVERGDLLTLNEDTHPNCFLHRSHPSDVARVEHLTFVCTRERDDAGPNNNWMQPDEAHAKIDALFAGSMRGRTLYVVPYCMGPIDSPFSRCGVELTDSPYVVANMRLMTRMGAAALARIEREGQFVKGVHGLGELDPDKRLILHFPETLTIKSFGSGYGGNALLGKKCHALRIGSWQARSEGWLAEHMLIVGIQDPAGEIHYIAAAFPSQCGKTNLSMLVPPAAYIERGWKVWTVGDDICWMHPGPDGRLWAINPEAGFFGVAPGTSAKTNPNALAMLNRDTIFTNVGLTADRQPWWEGLDDRVPALDWQGRAYDPANGPAAHANARFTVAARQCPSASPTMDDPAGVPLSAIVFGGRRESLVPLVLHTRDWTHGVLAGASMASETTAAATGAVGVVRRDPMAMKPFCGYNFADYFAHWLSLGQRGLKLPPVFQVNWFRKGADGGFLWPGFGDNMRVLAWIVARAAGRVDALDTAIGWLPRRADLDLAGLDLPVGAAEELTHVDLPGWRAEFAQIDAFLAELGDRMPHALLDEHARVSAALAAADVPPKRAAAG